VQGSGLGPTLFNINSTDLRPESDLNKYFKYADDAYLVVPGTNEHSIQGEITHHASWAKSCNLKLNPTKTSEIVFSRKGAQVSPPHAGILRVETIKVLGVHVDNKLNFQTHISETLKTCNQTLIALRIMKNYGMNNKVIKFFFKVLS